MSREEKSNNVESVKLKECLFNSFSYTPEDCEDDCGNTLSYEGCDELMREDFTEMVEILNTAITADIVVFGKFGLWDGIHYGHKFFTSLNEVFQECVDRDINEVEVYVDNDTNDLIINAYHHDGVNVFYVRKYNESDGSVSEADCDMHSIVMNCLRNDRNMSECVKELKERFSAPIGNEILDKWYRG